MIKVAISGNIASGKSQVENILLTMGFKVIDSDKINHDLLTKNKDVINEIINSFGKNICDEFGAVSKKKLADIVFTSLEQKQKLEKIMHKRISEKTDIFFEQNKNENMVFVAVPLLFEAKMENKFDKIIFISAEEKLRLNRLMKRNNYTIEQAQMRINSQDKEEEKIKKSDFVIYNNGNIENLKKAVYKVVDNLKKNSNKLS